MSTALTLFGGGPSQLPAHLQEFESNLTGQETVPSLMVTGKIWQISEAGTKTKLTKQDPEEGEVPVQTLPVVILEYAKRRGRSYYPGAYNPDATAQPTCWSPDGVKPHDSVQEKQSLKCEGCPMSIKGSKVDNSGRQMVACSQHRMLAVLPLLPGRAIKDSTPLRLKIAVTSDWDKTNPREAEGWFAFQQLIDRAQKGGLTHTAQIITKLRFDPDTAYPKILFSPARWLSPAETAEVKPIVQSEDVKRLVSGVYTPAGADGKPAEVDSDDEALVAQATTAVPAPAAGSQSAPPAPATPAAPAAPAPAKPAATRARKATPAPVSGPVSDPVHPAQAVRPGAPAAAPAATTVPAWDDDEPSVQGGGAATTAVTAPVPSAPAAPAISTEIPDELAGIIDQWDD